MPEATAKVPELVVPRASRLLRERITFAAAIAIPAVGTAAALATLPLLGFTALDAALVTSLFFANVIGIEVGYHRLFSHRAFVARPVLRIGLAIAGAAAIQGPVAYWVSHHRRHHQLADTPADPHTPHGFGRGPRALLRGIFHAHIGWIFGRERAAAGRYARDLLSDRAMLRIDRLYTVWMLASFLAPAVIAGLVSREPFGALRGFLWGGCARIFIVQHGTYAINSLCHLGGTRPFATRDRSVNHAWLVPLSLGGAWHNNHHAFPSTASNQLCWWHLDPCGWVIGLFVAVRLAKDPTFPSRRAIELKRARAAQGGRD